MANVVDTKLYDILGVSPSVSENELKKVAAQIGRWCQYVGPDRNRKGLKTPSYASLANASCEWG